MANLKVKHNYGFELTPIYFDKLIWFFGDKDYAINTAATITRLPRFYSLIEQEIQHPILVWHNKKDDSLELFNGGLRIMVAVEKGYDSIDGIVKSFNMPQPSDEDFVMLRKFYEYQKGVDICEFSEFSEEFIELLYSEDYSSFNDLKNFQRNEAKYHFQEEDLHKPPLWPLSNARTYDEMSVAHQKLKLKMQKLINN
jgi:hypothetical protein